MNMEILSEENQQTLEASRAFEGVERACLRQYTQDSDTCDISPSTSCPSEILINPPKTTKKAQIAKTDVILNMKIIR